MIFGSKPKYIFAEYNKKKFHCLGKSYSFEQIPVQVCSCPIKINNDKAEVFFVGNIFNSYVVSFEENVAILKSFDDKLTIIKYKENEDKKKLEDNKLYTFKIISEDHNTREVELYKFDEFFPGLKVTGNIELNNGKEVVVTKFGKGSILFQSNEPKKTIDCMLVKMDSENDCVFVEINNPVERTTVRVVKDLKNNKIVQNGNIKGILLDSKDKKVGDEVDVYTKRVYFGSYAFIEDIKEGIYSVELVSRSGNISKVRYKGFIGECVDKKVSKIMKGRISEIKGNTFKFKILTDEENSDPVKNAIRSDGFEMVKVTKKVKISNENEIGTDQLKAIEYIKQNILNKANTHDELVDLFKKYIQKCTEKDYLCLFYLEFLIENKMCTDSEVNGILKFTSQNFTKHAANVLNEISVLKLIFNKKKSQNCFLKILDAEIDKIKFIKENTEFLVASINYVYEKMENPRIIVESIMDKSFKNWCEYLKHENGQYKRNLFRRMVKMDFKKNEIKSIFKMWLEFEEASNGNVDEVHQLANQYVESQKQK